MEKLAAGPFRICAELHAKATEDATLWGESCAVEADQVTQQAVPKVLDKADAKVLREMVNMYLKKIKSLTTNSKAHCRAGQEAATAATEM